MSKIPFQRSSKMAIHGKKPATAGQRLCASSFPAGYHTWITSARWPSQKSVARTVNDACDDVSTFPACSGQSAPWYWSLQPMAIVLNVNVWSSVQAVSVTISTRTVRQQNPLASKSPALQGRRPAPDAWSTVGAAEKIIRSTVIVYLFLTS
jgi:hypothetical protein